MKRRETTHYEFFMQAQKNERKYKEMEEGGKEKKKHLFGLSLHKSGPWALQQLAQNPIVDF